MHNKLGESELEKWIRSKHMSTKELCEIVGCSRPTISKAKLGIPIAQRFTDRIYKVTGLDLPSAQQGRPKGKTTRP